ncbi:MAG TPA: hypothetical protein VGL80_16450 [Pseudonocardiaceae bacterium]
MLCGPALADVAVDIAAPQAAEQGSRRTPVRPRVLARRVLITSRGRDLPEWVERADRGRHVGESGGQYMVVITLT